MLFQRHRRTEVRVGAEFIIKCGISVTLRSITIARISGRACVDLFRALRVLSKA